ncbi:MAG: hypothetical protein KY447_08870 [Actinobacteria bacterium]|nr:hypothetical protein [Actinomycetota bacterium]
MAQVLLQHLLDERGAEARVHSAGELRSGVPASPGSVRAMAARGLDLRHHRSRTISAEQLTGADLVICMARRHVREAVLAFPDAWPRIFTLKELVRRGELVGPRPPGLALQAWLDQVGQGRRTTDLLGDDPADDVDDPIGLPDSAYETTAAELAELIQRLVDLAFPAPTPAAASGGTAASSPTVTQEG